MLKLYDRIWDEADYVVPPAENGAFFVTTNVVITPNQTWGTCPEVSASKLRSENKTLDSLVKLLKFFSCFILNIWMLNISFKHFYVKRQFYALGRFFSRDSHLLTHDRHLLNIRLHLFLWFQDPVSVPESICIVGDTRTNTSQSCNNDNYDSNKSEKSSLRCNCCIACLAAIELTVVVIIPSVLKMYPSPLCWPHHQSHQLIDHPSFIFKIWSSISDQQYVSRYKLSFRNQGFIQTFFLTLSIKISGWRWKLIQMPSDLFAVDKNWMRKLNIYF